MDVFSTFFKYETFMYIVKTRHESLFRPFVLYYEANKFYKNELKCVTTKYSHRLGHRSMFCLLVSPISVMTN